MILTFSEGQRSALTPVIIRRGEGREDGGWGEGLEGADIKDKLCSCWAIILEIFFPALILGLLKYICTELLTRVHPPNNTLNLLK